MNNKLYSIEDTMFPVKEVPAIYSFNEMGAVNTNVNTGHKFIIREDTGEVLSCMTNSYKLVKNKTINKISSNIIQKQGGRIKEVSLFKKGAKTTVKWEFPQHKLRLTGKDDLTPEIIWSNSYDGTCGLNILAGAFRLVCTNGLVIGVVANKYQNKHSVYNVELEDIEGIIEETIKKTKIIMKNDFPKLIETKVEDTHILSMLKMFPLTSSEYMTNYLVANNPTNLWDLLNAATNVATHGLNRKLESTHKLESKIYNKIWKMASA